MAEKEPAGKVYRDNQEALSGVIESYYADIFRFCLYMVQREEDAYDITQETFLKFIKYGSSYRQHNVKGYLVTIARNLCMNYFREQKSGILSCGWETVETLPAGEDCMQEVENAVYLLKLLGELSPENREVVILRAYEGFPYKEIAKLTGCHVSTVKSRFRLGVRHLKKLMEDGNGKP